MIDVTTETFQTDVLNSPIPVLVDFYGDYCAPCRQMQPVLQRLASELQDQGKVVGLDVTKSPSLAVEYGVTVVPTFLAFNKGTVIARLIGIQSAQALRAALGLA